MGVTSVALWEATVAQHFGFLTERFGMKLINRDSSRWWMTSITYARDEVAVVICWRSDLCRTEVEVARVVGGSIPPHPASIQPNTPIDRYDLAQLLLLRAPSEVDVLANLGGLDPESVAVSLAFQAKALERHATDVLQGDLAVFESLDRLLKKELPDPQQVTVSLPNGGSKEDIQRAVESLRRLHPGAEVIINFRKHLWSPWKRLTYKP